jgi:hypothetical protein
MKAEDQQLAADPFWYLQQLQQRHNSAAARVEVRKRRRLGAAVHEGDEGEAGGQGLLVTGRAARRDDRHRYDFMLFLALFIMFVVVSRLRLSGLGVVCAAVGWVLRTPGQERGGALLVTGR